MLSHRLLPQPRPHGSCAALGIDGWLLDEEIEFQGLRDYGFSCFSVFLPVCLSPCVSFSLLFFFFVSLFLCSPFQFLPLFSFSTPISKFFVHLCLEVILS